MNKDIKPRNYKGEPHGYWERYHINGCLNCKGNYVDGKREGYWESYQGNGKLWYKGYFINDKRDGYWEYYDYNYGELDEIEYHIN